VWLWDVIRWVEAFELKLVKSPPRFMIEFVLYGRDHPLGNISLSHKSFPAILVSARGWVSRETTTIFFPSESKKSFKRSSTHIQ
jgi:hypothetical protein